MEFKYFSFQAWKVMELNCWLWKGMENYSVCGTEIIAGVDYQGQNKIKTSYVRRYPKTRDDFRKWPLNFRSWKTRKSHGISKAQKSMNPASETGHKAHYLSG